MTITISANLTGPKTGAGSNIAKRELASGSSVELAEAHANETLPVSAAFNVDDRIKFKGGQNGGDLTGTITVSNQPVDCNIVVGAGNWGRDHTVLLAVPANTTASADFGPLEQDGDIVGVLDA